VTVVDRICKSIPNCKKCEVIKKMIRQHCHHERTGCANLGHFYSNTGFVLKTHKTNVNRLIG